MLADCAHYVVPSSGHPANTRHSANADLMLGQRRRRWPNIKSALAECLVIAGECEREVAVTSTLVRYKLGRYRPG